MPNDSSKPTEVTSTRNDEAVESTTAPPQASVTLSDEELEAITGGAGNSVAMQSLTLANEGISTARSGGDDESFDCSELVQWASR